MPKKLALFKAIQKTANMVSNADQARDNQPNTFVLSAPEVENIINQNSTLVQENERLKLLVGSPVRKRLPETRRAVTHKFSIGGHEGYMTVGLFDNGDPGELFITMAKEGSTIGGLMDTIGTLTSLSLQYGVGIETLAKKFSHQRFEPSGFTGNPEIKTASSIIDYVFRWMELHFVTSRQVPQAAKPSVTSDV